MAGERDAKDGGGTVISQVAGAQPAQGPDGGPEKPECAAQSCLWVWTGVSDYSVVVLPV